MGNDAHSQKSATESTAKKLETWQVEDLRELKLRWLKES